MPIPTDEAWAYFMKHHDAIRGVCSAYLLVPRMEVPNTRVTDGAGRILLRESGEQQRGSIPLEVTHTIADFDAAVTARDSTKLTDIMNRAWLSLPEDRAIYREPGVTEMCNLLDGTVDGFFDDSDGFGEDDQHQYTAGQLRERLHQFFDFGETEDQG